MFWGCAPFLGPSCQKREILDPPPRKKFWLITEELIFWYFWVCVSFPSFCFFLLFFCLFLFWFFGGFKGQVRWPKGPPHLAPNPPYLFVSFSFFFVEGLFCFLFIFAFLFCFLEKILFPLKRTFLLTFQCLRLLLPSFLFQFPFWLCLSLSLFCSLIYFFLPGLLSSLLSLLPCFCLFVSLPCFFASVSSKELHRNIKF